MLAAMVCQVNVAFGKRAATIYRISHGLLAEDHRVMRVHRVHRVLTVRQFFNCDAVVYMSNLYDT